MNCEKCQDVLSDFLDGTLSGEDQTNFNAHLEECLPCFSARDELNSIVSFCREHRGEYDAPPNERALWLRIQNTVESELAGSAVRNPTRTKRRESWWGRTMSRSWELSVPQMAMAVVAIIVVASLATILGLRGMQNPGTERSVAATSGGERSRAQTVALTGDRQNLDISNRAWNQQQIKYWSQIVEERKANWNPQVRADFEHNLDLLDETVDESLKKLTERPHDEVTEEMLNSALNDKMQLLKEFSDL